MPDLPQVPEAVVFFARDFLADEFAKLGQHWPDVQRVYIVVSAAERARIMAIDPEAQVYDLDATGQGGTQAIEDAGDIAFNTDRHLRYLASDEVRGIVGAVHDLCDRLLRRHKVRYYLDEPVSGYPNAQFNLRFRQAGALCLHFQASWLPHHMFFSSDAAQDEPVPLRLLDDGAARVAAHVCARADGQGRPVYVIGYEKLHKRLADIAVTVGKALYRRIFRRSAAYIDRDPSAHLLHAGALARSLTGHYDKALDGRERLLVFPLHYEPEAVLFYYSAFHRQEEIAARLLDSLPLGWKLVLKEHPSQPGALHLAKWQPLRASKRVAVLPGAYPASALLPLRPVVVSIGSTFALEAALAGCPVGVLGGVHFAGAPGIVRLQAPEDWHQLIPGPTGKDSEFAPDALLAWYGGFIDAYCFEGNIMRGQSDLGDVDRLIRAIKAHDESEPVLETAR